MCRTYINLILSACEFLKASRCIKPCSIPHKSQVLPELCTLELKRMWIKSHHHMSGDRGFGWAKNGMCTILCELLDGITKVIIIILWFLREFQIVVIIYLSVSQKGWFDVMMIDVRGVCVPLLIVECETH